VARVRRTPFAWKEGWWRTVPDGRMEERVPAKPVVLQLAMAGYRQEFLDLLAEDPVTFGDRVQIGRKLSSRHVANCGKLWAMMC
jgi:hypothetical protein